MATFVENRKARFDYEILETFEAGLVLAGYEVKSIKLGRAKLEGAYVIIRGGEAYLVETSIAPYQAANMPKEYDPMVPRKLLLSKKELTKLERETDEKGLTIVPLRLYNKARKLKLEIALAKGKKKTDKRETIKKRETKRTIERLIKQQK